MESSNENNETWEVPVMLSPENLDYDELARLNPFYDKIMALWSQTPLVTDTTVGSDGSSSTSSPRSMRFGNNPSTLRHASSSSPLLRQYQSCTSLHVTETPDVAFRPGNQSKPSYQTTDRFGSGQMTTVEYGRTSYPKQPQPHQREWVDLSVLDAPLRQKPTSRKKLFGEHGWLGCTADLKDLPRGSQRFNRLRGLGKKLIKHAEDLADDMITTHSHPHPPPLHSRIIPKSSIPISLDPPSQAQLYSEMEVMICTSANKFLLEQHNEGRLSDDSIRKVTHGWGAKNRPQVIEFQFDQATQRQLILANVRTLRFHGECVANPILLKSNLMNWNAASKEMSVRTFCAPDSAIRKHMHDIHKLLDMLGASLALHLAFQDLQMRTLSVMKNCLEQRCQRGGEMPFRSMGKYEESHWLA